MPKSQSVKVWVITLRLLRKLYAVNGEKQIAILHRLVCAEYEKVIGPLPEDA